MVVEMKLKVKFRSVGRAKRTWIAHVANTKDAIAAEAKSGGKLMSSDVWAQFDEDRRGGVLLAGMHEVGTFEVLSAGVRAQR